MPSRTITVILNANHSKRFALLLRSDVPKDILDAILHDARNKFRVKGLKDVFFRGGTLLDEASELQNGLPPEVWVGKGEPYSGPPPAPERLGGGQGDVRILADRSFVDDKAIKQLQQVAALHAVRLAVGMPDLHPGNRFPIGCAIAAEGIYPALIGSDVGCGIALYRLSQPTRSQPSASKLAAMLRGLDDPWTGRCSNWLAKYGITRDSPFDQSSLGTVGAGNHFAEICTVEDILDPQMAQSLDIQYGGLYLLVHTGSRGLGASILAKETTSDANPFIPADSPHLLEYLKEHDYAVQWAVANRDLVAHRIKQCVTSPGVEEEVQLDKILDVTHNSVIKHSLAINGEPDNYWIHRKGAAPSDKGIAPCPGSRGHFSWLLKPEGDGQLNAYSLAHGAGRRYGRQALHDGNYRKESLTSTLLGSEVICTDRDLLVEERPEAYKDVRCVVEDMEDKNMCKGVVVLRPVVTYKIREAGESRK